MQPPKTENVLSGAVYVCRSKVVMLQTCTGTYSQPATIFGGKDFFSGWGIGSCLRSYVIMHIVKLLSAKIVVC